MQTGRLGQHIDVLVSDTEIHANGGPAGEVTDGVDRREHRNGFFLGVGARRVLKRLLKFKLQSHLSSLDELCNLAIRNVSWRKIQSVANIRAGDTSQIPSEFTYPIDKKVL